MAPTWCWPGHRFLISKGLAPAAAGMWWQTFSEPFLYAQHCLKPSLVSFRAHPRLRGGGRIALLYGEVKWLAQDPTAGKRLSQDLNPGSFHPRVYTLKAGVPDQVLASLSCGGPAGCVE